jgi:photosystem II stability/assembly factor-like uncharacterized protein
MLPGLAGASMPNWTGVEVRNFAQSAQDPSVIYAAANLGVFKSSDHGNSWQPMKLPYLTGDSAVIVHPEKSAHLFVLMRNRSSGYYESLDAGHSWTWQTVRPVSAEVERSGPVTPVVFLAVDPARYGGAWWALFSGSLFRSVDQGKSWQLNAQASGPIHHTANASYRFSGNTLFHSDNRGNSWRELHQFQSADRSGELSQFMSLSNGLLMVRHGKLWLQSSDEGKSWEAATNGFEQLPDHQQELGVKAGMPMPWRTSCRVDASPVSPAHLLARCASSNGAWPSTVCLKRSDDWGRRWVDVGEGCQAAGLPTAWSPTAFLWDRADGNVLWLAWMAGGVYRTKDAGNLWMRADEGLQFPNPRQESFEALNEPALHRAVFYRDLPAIERLLAEGSDINVEGNYVGSVLAADLRAAQLERQDSGSSNSIYFKLRQLGAIPRQVRALPRLGWFPESSRLLVQAVALGRSDIVEDLIRNGYDWGSQTRDASGENSSSELLDSHLARLGKPMSYWVEAYIHAAVFPSADQTVADLFSMSEPALALKVLAAASKSQPFDRQTGAASSIRREIVTNLLLLKKNEWALRVFTVTPRPYVPAAFDSLRLTLYDDCDFALLQAVDSPEASLTCLAKPVLRNWQKRQLLELLDQRGQLTLERWQWLLETAATNWMLRTAAYRRNADLVEPLRGMVGIAYEIKPGTVLVVNSLRAHSPAKRAGVKAGDQIVEIAGVAVTGMAPNEVQSRFRGRPGTIVPLKLRRGDKILSVQLRRQSLDAMSQD